MTQVYNLDNLNKGDTFNGLQFTLSVNGVAKDLTGVGIDCWFRYGNASGDVVKKNTVGAGITLVDAVAGIFKIDPFVVSFSPGVYYYDVEFNFAGTIKTYVGGNFKVIQTVTNG